MCENQTPARPNVLLIVTHQQRWDTVGAYGSPIDLTPNIDDLAREGCLVERMITPQPLDAPAHATLQTGKYATEVDVWSNKKSLSSDVETLADRFSRAGYDTGFVGTWHLSGSSRPSIPTDHRGGYEDYWIGADSTIYDTEPTEGTLYDGTGEPVSYETYRADGFTDFALDGMDALSEPYLLVVSYHEPCHNGVEMSFVAPDGYAEGYEQSTPVPKDLVFRQGDWPSALPDYYGAVKRLDECVGKLRSRLEDTSDRESIIGYTSLYGCDFNTRPGEYKRTPHRSATQVPAVFWGEAFEDGGNVSSTRDLLDIHATLIDAGGLEVPSEIRGESLLPVIAGKKADAGGEAFVQISESQIGRAIATDRFVYAVAAPKLEGWQAGWGKPANDLYVERYLYDHGRDPHEHENLVGRPSYRERSQRLRERLADRIEEIEGQRPEIRPAEVGWGEL